MIKISLSTFLNIFKRQNRHQGHKIMIVLTKFIYFEIEASGFKYYTSQEKHRHQNNISIRRNGNNEFCGPSQIYITRAYDPLRITLKTAEFSKLNRTREMSSYLKDFPSSRVQDITCFWRNFWSDHRRVFVPFS